MLIDRAGAVLATIGFDAISRAQYRLPDRPILLIGECAHRVLELARRQVRTSRPSPCGGARWYGGIRSRKPCGHAPLLRQMAQTVQPMVTQTSAPPAPLTHRRRVRRRTSVPAPLPMPVA